MKKVVLIILCLFVFSVFSSCFNENGAEQSNEKRKIGITDLITSSTVTTTDKAEQNTSNNNIKTNDKGILYKDNFYEKQFDTYDEYKAEFCKITSFKAINDIIDIDKDDLDYYSKGDEVSLLLKEKYFISMKIKNKVPSYIKFHLTGAYVSFNYLNYLPNCDIKLSYMTRRYTNAEKTECQSSMKELYCTKIFTTKDNCKVYRSPNLKLYEWFKDDYDTEFVMETGKSNIDVKTIQNLIENIEYEKILIK